MLRTTSPQGVRAGMDDHGWQCRGDGRSIGRWQAGGQFRSAMAVIHFMNVQFICVLSAGVFLFLFGPVAAIDKVTAVAQIAGAFRRWQIAGQVAGAVAIAVASLHAMTRGEVACGCCLAVLTMVMLAAGLHPAPQQRQPAQQAKPFDHAVAIGGTAVAAGQHAKSTRITFQWRQESLVGADGQQGRVGKNDGAPIYLKQQAYVHSCFRATAWATVCSRHYVRPRTVVFFIFLHTEKLPMQSRGVMTKENR